MIDGDNIKCDEPGCDQTVKNYQWGKIKADDWFFQRDPELAWCSKHHPEWVAEWR